MGAASPADNIRVVGINPGPIATERLETIMQKRAQDLLGDAEQMARDVQAAAVRPRRQAGRNRHMVAFLASDLSAYTTGTVITIDAGAASKGNAI